MGFSTDNYALIRGLLVGVVILAGASACSRDKPADTGAVSDTSAAILTDTASHGTSSAPGTPTSDQPLRAAGDTSAAAGTTAPSSETRAARPAQDSDTAGYRAMERDTSASPSDTARPTADTTLTGDQSSVAPSDSAPMEVSTPTAGVAASAGAAVAIGQASTDVSADRSTEGDVLASQETVSPEVAEVDTSATEVAADQDTMPTAAQDSASADSSHADGSRHVAGAAAVGVVAGAAAADGSDSDRSGADRAEAERSTEMARDDGVSAEANGVRPPEDSTEVLGEDSTEIVGNVKSNEPADEVGAARISGDVTGAAVLAGTTFQGGQCVEADSTIMLDMSNTPQSLNPCGLGSMVPSRLWTKKE